MDDSSNKHKSPRNKNFETMAAVCNNYMVGDEASNEKIMMKEF
jgi:hypothetical protein